MTTIAKLVVNLTADAGGFINIMDQAEKKTQSWSASISKRMKEVGGSISNVGQNMTTYLTLPIIALGVSSLKMASDLEETRNKVRVVFGEMSDDVLLWSKDASTAMGMSQNAALGGAATFGNLFRTIGLGKEPVKNMSMDLVQLASDLASFHNADPSEVLMNLRAGLIGEAEPMRKFGVNINEAAVALKAMQMGLIETNVDMVKINGLTLSAEKALNAYNTAVEKYGEGSLEAREAAQKQAEIQQKLDEAMQGTTNTMTEAQKVQVRYALIMEQTTTAQGDFARTSEGAANLLRILQAQYIDMASTLATQLLPYVIKFMQWLSKLIVKFEQLSPEQKNWILILLGVAAALGPVLTGLGSLITMLGAGIGALGAVNPLVLIMGFVTAAYLLYRAWTENWGGIQEKTAEFWGWLKPILMEIWTWLKSKMPVATKALEDAWNWVKVNAPAAIQSLFDAWEKLRPTLQALWVWLKTNIPIALQTFSDAWKKLEPILKMALDGILWLINAFMDAPPWVQKLALAIGAIIIIGLLLPNVFGGAAASTTPLLGSIFSLVGTFSKLLGVAAIVIQALEFFGVSTGVVGATIVGLSGVIGATLSAVLPILIIVIGVILLVVGAVILLYQMWTTNFLGIRDTTLSVIAFVRGVINGGLQFIHDFTSGKLGALSQIWKRNWDAIKSLVNLAIANIKLVIDLFHAAQEGDWHKFGEILRKIWDNMWKGIGIILSTAWENIKTLVNAGWEKLKTAFETGWEKFKTFITNIPQTVGNSFTDMDWGDIGLSIITGIANGLLSGLPIIIDAAQQAANAALEAAKGFLGIQSPSKVFEMQVGWQMAAGAALGWEHGVDKMMTPTMPGLMPATGGNVAGLSAVGGGGGRGGAVHVTVENRPLLSLGDRYEVEQVLKPMLQGMLRDLGVEVNR